VLPDDVPPAFAKRSWLDHVVRFGCGGIIGLAVVLGILPYSDLLGESLYRWIGILGPITLGILAIGLGDSFLRAVSSLLRRLFG